MINSEIPSSPEEKWTAYLDGKLSLQDAAAFEREQPGAVAERALHARLANAVRRHSPSPKLRNADFFNERILHEISPRPAPAAPAKRRLWPLWSLAAASACCMLAGIAIYATFVRGTDATPDRYLAKVVSATAGDESLDATVLDADGLQVVWISGLDPLPKDYALE
jgi:anti-sigma factor RsiW